MRWRPKTPQIQPSPPTEEELVGPVASRYYESQSVVEHFLGLSQAQALQMYHQRLYFVGEYFAYMTPVGLAYYLPPLIQFFKTADLDNQDSGIFGVISTLRIIITSTDRPPLTAEVKSLIKEFAACLRQRSPDAPESEYDLAAIERA